MNILDVSAYILEQHGPMTAMKLQKLAYYSQCWSLVWDERPLFDDRIEAWANGPVSPRLYAAHKGKFEVKSGDVPGDPASLDVKAKETVDAVMKFYGDKSAQWLSDLTHSEAPWRDARDGLTAGERSNRCITPAAMAEFYGSL
jgi:uncharacterized phage-associated protein